MPQAGRRDGAGRLPRHRPGGDGAAAHGKLDVRSLCLCARDAGAACRPCRLRLRDAGARQRADHPLRHATSRRAVAAGGGQGTSIAAFALSEAEAGSDVAALATTARRDGDQWRLDGSKTWISNGGLADLYVVFARTGEAPGAKGLSAFIVDAGTPGFEVAKVIDLVAPHPLGTLAFDGAKVPAEHLLGAPGEGFKIAMATLDVFRSTVGAAALGFARRALDETVRHATTRSCSASRSPISS